MLDMSVNLLRRMLLMYVWRRMFIFVVGFSIDFFIGIGICLVSFDSFIFFFFCILIYLNFLVRENR